MHRTAAGSSVRAILWLAHPGSQSRSGVAFRPPQPRISPMHAIRSSGNVATLVRRSGDGTRSLAIPGLKASQATSTPCKKFAQVAYLQTPHFGVWRLSFMTSSKDIFHLDGKLVVSPDSTEDGRRQQEAGTVYGRSDASQRRAAGNMEGPTGRRMNCRRSRSDFRHR